jgi:cell division protein DivIC
MKTTLRFFLNKYLLAITAFAALILFFDKNDIFSQIKRKQELDGLNAKIDYYKQQNKLTNTELNNLQNNPVTLEKYAREKYFMKRDNEEIFIIDTSTTNTEKK